MKVALVHDWLIHMRGGDKVLEALAELYPEATIYTLFANKKNLSPSLQRMKIKTSVLQYFPYIRRYYPWLLPLLPFFIKTLRIPTVDVVVSTNHCVAKGVAIPKGAKHICYCFTPMRYLWGFEDVYFNRFPKWFLGLLQPVLNWLRRWDVASSKNVDLFYSISEAVRNRIKKIYQREAPVIYPPVDTQMFTHDSSGQNSAKDFYLVVSALTPYKRVDLVIEAFNQWDRKLLIAGDGALRNKYQDIARGDNIHFLGRVSNRELIRLYANAKAVLFPQIEEFGIVALEAQASGTPVVAFAEGGALETVKEGVFFYEQSPEAIRKAIIEAESKEFSPQRLREQALKFDKTVFKTKIKQVIENAIR